MVKTKSTRKTAQRRAYDAGKLRPKNKTNAKTAGIRSSSSPATSSTRTSRKPKATGPGTDLAFEGTQAMVPGVPPYVPPATSAGGGRMTVQTIRLAVDEVSAHRVQAAKEGERNWSTWALRTLNQRAGVVGMSGGRR